VNTASGGQGVKNGDRPECQKGLEQLEKIAKEVPSAFM